MHVVIFRFFFYFST
ncbi:MULTISPECIES: pheST operon leader peptide PheM [Enterobacterales]